MIHLVLLSGGSGTRLWPLSNKARSKQFLKVLKDDNGQPVSMVQRVFSQIKCVQPEVDITIATCADQESALRMQLGDEYSLVIEPERRDTAPAIMLACAHLAFEQHADAGDTVVVMPIDSYASQDFYDQLGKLEKAAQLIGGIVLLGVRPTHPSEKYGYIIPTGEKEGDVWKVGEFREKPDEKTAKQYIERGALWNCGVFAFRLEHLLEVIDSYTRSNSFEAIRREYNILPKRSFDYEVVEKSANVSMIPYFGEWKDLGTWNSLTDEMTDFIKGHVVASGNDNVHVINETSLPLVVSGLKDSVVVSTYDGILVCSKTASANIKELVCEASASRPMYERRRWGEYRVIDSSEYPDGRKSLTKELIIEAGKQLSYQRHSHRSEVWTVVSGRGEVVLDAEVQSIAPGAVIDIRPLQMHAVRSFSNLRIIEVQLGDPLSEEDIERFGNYWR